MWPPSASPSLYPMPIYGEASNHRYLSWHFPYIFVVISWARTACSNWNLSWSVDSVLDFSLHYYVYCSCSSVGLDNPNLSDYPRAEHSLKQSQEVTLKAGDAVFIPEGWWVYSYFLRKVFLVAHSFVFQKTLKLLKISSNRSCFICVEVFPNPLKLSCLCYVAFVGCAAFLDF